MKKTLATLALFILAVSWSPQSEWLQAQVVGDSVTLTWTAPTQDVNNNPLMELTGYRLYEGSTSGGPYSFIADIPAGNLSYIVPSLAEGGHYWVLTAYNSSGESDYSNEAGVIVSGAIVRPKAPGSLAASLQ